MATKTLMIFPFDLMSHYLRCIELASRYKGYRIVFASSTKYNAYVTEAGYGLFDVELFDADSVMKCSRRFDFSWLNKQDIERVFLSQVAAITHYQPCLVIGDTSPPLKMAAEYKQVKYISLMNGYMTKYYAETRALPQIHPGYPHLQKLPSSIGNKIIRIAEKISFRHVHKPFRQLRRKYKLKGITDYLSEMEGDENVICDDATLFPQTPLPKHYNIIGPLLYHLATTEEDLLKQLDKRKPSICVCMGSSGNWEALRFLSQSKYKGLNIITAGDEHGVLRGDHVIQRQFVNLDSILPECRYLICHGGNGTIYKGIVHHVFSLCMTTHFEQEWNVQALEKRKLGTSINKDPEKIVDHYFNTLF